MTPDLDFIRSLPKTELHVHIEGTLEPEMMFGLAERNEFDLPFESVDATREAYSFTDLQSFLDIYYQGAAVLQTERDFYDLMFEYLKRASADGVRHAEVFFDPQTHTARGIGFEVFTPGFRAAIKDARSAFGITADMILCFLRHLGGDEAVATLAMAESHLEGVIAVGLESPSKLAIGRKPQLLHGAETGRNDKSHPPRPGLADPYFSGRNVRIAC